MTDVMDTKSQWSMEVTLFVSLVTYMPIFSLEVNQVGYFA